MIPSPKLDDRTYRDIVDEALRLIPRYCPEWTNHNPSDPGITLLELTAWMTELILYRLNRVPEKNYLAFLDLIGVKLRSPQPAKTLLAKVRQQVFKGEMQKPTWVNSDAECAQSVASTDGAIGVVMPGVAIPAGADTVEVAK